MRLLTAAFALAAVLSMAAIAEAQQKPGESKYIGGNYRPTRPTLSPYMNYFRGNTGLTDQYRTFIRPQQRLQQRFNREGYQNRSNQNRFGLLDRNVQGLQGNVQNLERGAQQIRQPAVSPTGNSATFMNYSHYYSTGRR